MSPWHVVAWCALGAVALVLAVFAWTFVPQSKRRWLSAIPWLLEAALWIPVIIVAMMLHLVVGLYYVAQRVYLIADDAMNEMLRKKR